MTAHVAAFVVALLAACSGGTDPNGGAACHAGDQEACVCASGGHGSQTCTNGTFGACQCGALPDAGSSSDGAVAPTDSGATTDSSGQHDGGPAKTDAGFGLFMGPCTVTADCPAGDTCSLFAAKGSFCTHACTVATDCEAPSPKCTPKGYCAVPD